MPRRVSGGDKVPAGMGGGGRLVDEGRGGGYQVLYFVIVWSLMLTNFIIILYL